MNVLVRLSEKPGIAFSRAKKALYREGKNIDPKLIVVIKGREPKKIRKNDFQGTPRTFLFENKKIGTVMGLMALFGKNVPGIDSCEVGGMEIIYLSGPKCF